MIKEKVRQNVLGDNHPNETSVDVTSEEQPETPPEPLEAENPTEVAYERENHQKVVEMAESIKQRWERVKEMSIEERPTIPQIKNDRHTKETIKFANQGIIYIKSEIATPIDLPQINQIIHVAAPVIAEQW